jgi:guanylate kinase
MSSELPPRYGMLVVISAPSGGGKSTLLGRLLSEVENLRYSVSYTTRQPRPGEEDGVHYHFVSEADFERMRERGELLESAKVHGNYYGTGRRYVEEELAKGHDLILDIDVQGAEAVSTVLPDSVRVFIMPPGFDILSERLRGRASDSPETVERRLRNARGEVARFREFQYVVVNDDLETALRSLISIIRAERERWNRSEARLQSIVETFERTTT